MTRFAIIAVALVLTGCATTAAEPRIEVRTVEVPVTVSCKVEIGPDPAYPDSDEALRAAPNTFERVKLLVAGRLLRIAREREISAALKACTG